MLRNDLIILMSEHDNDPVTVDLGGVLIDVESVGVDRAGIVLRLNRDDLRDVLRRDVSEPEDPHA